MLKIHLFTFFLKIHLFVFYVHNICMYIHMYVRIYIYIYIYIYIGTYILLEGSEYPSEIFWEIFWYKKFCGKINRDQFSGCRRRMLPPPPPPRPPHHSLPKRGRVGLWLSCLSHWRFAVLKNVLKNLKNHRH